jgi:hypothetical protein
MMSRSVVAVAVVALAACGGSSQPATTQTVGSAGATLKTSTSALTIPAGAVTQNVEVTLREAEPRHQGRAARVEVEPRGLALAVPGRLSVQVDDTNAKVKMHDANDDLVQVEVEDRNHGSWKTTMSKLGEIEVELEHGVACSPACAAGQECDDGACKVHVEDSHAKVCDPLCASGQECDDGVCKAHGEMEPGGAGGAICTPACGSGLECDNGICKPHKGG